MTRSPYLVGILLCTSAVVSQAQPPEGIHQLRSERGGYRYTLSIPPRLDAADPRPLVVALHFGGEVTPWYGRILAEQLVAPALGRLRPIVLAPDCSAPSWSDPGCEAMVLSLIDEVSAAYPVDRARLLLTGYSKGGIGTWMLAAGHPDRFSLAIPMAARAPEPALLARLQVPTHALHGERDALFDVAAVRRAVDDSRAAGKRIGLTVVGGAGHYDTGRFSEPLAALVPWIEATWGAR